MKLILCLLFTLLTHSAFAGAIEIPKSGSTISGISLIAGWTCDVAEALTLRIEDTQVGSKSGITIPVLYGGIRSSTIEACGDDDNGFAMLFDYNSLPDGWHTITLSNSGHLLDRAAFFVESPSPDYLTPMTEVLAGYQANGKEVLLRWVDDQQQFQAISAPCSFLPLEADIPDSKGNPAHWTISYSCNGTLKMEITALTSQGFTFAGEAFLIFQGNEEKEILAFEYAYDDIIGSSNDSPLYLSFSQSLTLTLLNIYPISSAHPFYIIYNGEYVGQFGSIRCL